jgi:plasmid stabilization system protein ParE
LRVRWLRTALANLESEAAYIGADSPAAAARVVERILASVSHLADHPALGRSTSRPEGASGNPPPAGRGPGGGHVE